MPQLDYVVIRSAAPLPIHVSPFEIEFEWDQVPLDIASFCAPLHDYLISIDAIKETAKWESVVEIRESISHPAKRIALKPNLKSDIHSAITAYLNALMGRNEFEFDLINPIHEEIEIRELVNRARSSIGGKILRQPIRIGIGDTELEISGKIPKPDRSPPAAKEEFEILGYIDSPSIWNRSIIVQTAKGGQKITLNADTRNFIEIVHAAQRNQFICRIVGSEMVDAKMNLIRTVQNITIEGQAEDSLE